MRKLVLAALLVTLVSPASAQATFPGANGKIAFSRGGDIWTMDPDGTNQVDLTNTAANESDPAWSPDGTKIAFVSNRAESARCWTHDCVGYTNELYVMDADGGNVTRLTETPHEEATPAWSPGAERIVYSRIPDTNGMHELYVVNADGSCPTRLIPGGSDIMPDWYAPANTKGGPLERLKGLVEELRDVTC
jgi:Tol biopolymer transport system component